MPKRETCPLSFQPNPVGSHLLCLGRGSRASELARHGEHLPWALTPAVAWEPGVGQEAASPVTAEQTPAQTHAREACRVCGKGLSPPTISEGSLLWKTEWGGKGKNPCGTSLPLVPGFLSIACDNSHC